MSAFGYGGSSNTSWRGNTTTQNALTDPTYSVAPAMSQPNFSPVATSPMDNPALRDVGDWEQSRKGPMGNMSYWAGDYYNRDAWANPLEKYFGNLSGQPTPDQMGKGYNPSGDIKNRTPIYGYAGPGQMNGNTAVTADPFSTGTPGRRPNDMVVGYDYNQNNQQLNKGLGGPTPGTPTNAKELYNSIGGLQIDQLMRLSGGTEGFNGNMSQISQDYANAYANPNYGKKLWGQQSNYGANNLTKAETDDWLKQSYGKLLNKMDSNYLL